MKDELRTDMAPSQSSFRKDFLWYFLGSFAPLLLGFIKTPIFTRHFSKTDFGNLGIISISFTFIGMLLFSWIGSCIWRYYGKYRKKNELKLLYSNLVFLFVLSFVILALISGIWYNNAKIEMVQNLVMFSFFQLIFSQLYQYYMVIIRLNGKVQFYTAFQSIKAFIGLILALFLVFYLGMDITALVLSLLLIDAFSLSVLIFLNPAKVRLSHTDVDRIVLLELLKYGSLGLVLNISLLTISYSDRYVIALYQNMEDVGIYDQVYKISQLSVMALITIFFNTISPKLLQELEVNYNSSINLIHKYIYGFILFGVPVVFYLSLFSYEISKFLLGKAFREGFIIMPFVFAATYLHGLSNFFELRLKFSNKMKKLGLIAISTAVSNLVLNLVFVRLYGYQWAAYTTLFSYGLMIVLFYINDPKVLRGGLLRNKVSFSMVGLLTIQYFLYHFLVDKLGIEMGIRIGIGLIFVAMFLLIFRKTLLKVEIPIN